MLRTIKVTIVMLFALATTALILGIMLYNRKQILLGRIFTLERGIVMIASTIGKNKPESSDALSLIERDIDSVSAEIITSPRSSDFWESYKQTLEIPVTDTISLAKRKRELQSFFKIDPVTQKPQRDPITRERIYKGPGTTDGVLADVIVSAETQLNLLNETRYQLVDLRTEYQETIKELNLHKAELRIALCDIVDRDNQIASMHNIIDQRNTIIAENEDDIIELNDQIFDAEHQLAIHIEDIVTLSNNVAIWKGKYEESRGRPETPTPKTWTAMSHGYKGKVASVDSECNFITIELNEKFIKEYQESINQDANTDAPKLLITRKNNGADTFISKIELSSIDTTLGLGAGTILTSWQQDSIHINDLVMY